MVGLVLLLFLVLVAIFADKIAPYDPYAVDYNAVKQPPSAAHLLGTDTLGRDELSRLIYGSRVSLVVGLVVVSIALTIGVPLGIIAGFFGGATDTIIMRMVDILMAIPFLVLALGMVAVVGPGLTNVMIVLGAVSWVSYTRLVRGVVLSLREVDYILAARTTGVPTIQILFRHLLPNAMGVVIVQASFGVSDAILAAAALSYLGLGAQPPTAEWGSMLFRAQELMRLLPLESVAPGAAIMLTVMSINFLGDALRDAMDPTLRQ